MRKLLRILIIYSSVYAARSCSQVPLSATYFSKKLSGHVIESKKVNLFGCVGTCIVTTNCMSFSFDFHSNQCEMNSGDSLTASESMVPTKGWLLYSDISAWPKSIARSCSELQCLAGQRCYPRLTPVCLPDGLMGSACSTSHDCKTERSRCLKSTCFCDIDTEYNADTGTCDVRCFTQAHKEHVYVEIAGRYSTKYCFKEYRGIDQSECEIKCALSSNPCASFSFMYHATALGSISPVSTCCLMSVSYQQMVDSDQEAIIKDENAALFTKQGSSCINLF